MKRREIIKGLTLLPFAGSAAASPLNDLSDNLNGVNDHVDLYGIIDEETVMTDETSCSVKKKRKIIFI